MKRRIAPLLENITESGVACLITMVQGNLFALGLGHWLIASRTGVIAGTIASVVLYLARTNTRWLVSIILGIATTVVDFFVHPGQFGPVAAEAIVTGLGAALLSYAVGFLWSRVRRGRRPSAGVAPEAPG